jgi:hypothetical protein
MELRLSGEIADSVVKGSMKQKERAECLTN